MLRILFCFLLLFFTHESYSNNGALVPVSGTHNYDVNLGNEDIVNQAGYITEPFDWDLSSDYLVDITCPSQEFLLGESYFKSILSSSLPSVGGGFYKLNEYLDIKIQVWIDGARNEYVDVPFMNESNNIPTGASKCEDGKVIHNAKFRTGSKGRVQFRVRKPIINGIAINEVSLVDVFGKLASPGVITEYGNMPISHIAIKAGILFVPERCVLNSGQTIEVEFNDIPGSSLDLHGDAFEKTVPVTMRCEGGEFEGGGLKINLALSGRATSFNQAFLRTTKDGYQGNEVIPDLGIKFKQLDGSALSINEFYPVTMQGNIGDWGFIAAPIAPAGADIPAGDFYATATIVAEFQ